MHFSDDIEPDIPDFMIDRGNLCRVTGCLKQALPGKIRCIDCEVTSALPGLLAEIEIITKTGR